MSYEYVNFHKLVKCVEHKKNLDEKYIKMKDWVIECCKSNKSSVGAFVFDQNSEGLLTLVLPVYKIEIVFEDHFVVINNVPLLKLVATVGIGDKKDEIINFYLAKNGLFYINEYNTEASHDYDDLSLYVEILDVTLEALKSKNIISF